MKILITFISTLFFFTNSIGQTGTYFILEGKVINKNTGGGLQYAHIGIPKLGIGTTSSDEGYFEVKIPRDKMEEELSVSFIGYKTYKKKISSLKNPCLLPLEVENNDLVEIEVLGDKAIENIIRKAVKRIPKNYPTHGHTNLAFYREARTDKDSNYIYLAEGVLKVYKKSYKKRKEGQVSLVQGRKINLKNPLDTVVRNGFSSGHMAPHRFDIVYNLEDFLQEKYFPVYEYQIEKITYYDGKPVYVIAFGKDYSVTNPPTEKTKLWKSSKVENGGSWLHIGPRRTKRLKARMAGKIYIEKNSLAIIRTEFAITKEGLKKWDDYPLYSGNWKGNTYTVNYQKLGEKWYFSDAFRKGTYGGGGIYTNEVKITEIHPEKSKPLPYQDRLTRNKRFSRMTGVYDPDFWANYNTTPLNTKLAASVEQMKIAQEAQAKLDPIYLAELEERRDSIELVKSKNELEKIKGEEVFDMSEVDLYRSQLNANKAKNGKKRNKNNFNRFSSYYGIGTHFITSESGPMGITLLSDENPQQSILNSSGEIKKREIEIVANLDYEFFFTKNLSVRLGTAFDFYNSRYKERSVGLGLQMNLSKARPFFLRTLAQYSNMKYYRKLEDVKNDFGKFKIDGEKFKAKKIRTAYGSRTHNLKLSTELAIELNPSREIYLRGSYFLPFHRRQDIWLQERRELFRKKSKVPVSNNRVQVTQNDIPFDGQITDNQSFVITLGYVIK